MTGEGFDIASLPTTTDMSDWFITTPYYAIGVYLGGENSDGTAPGISWLSSVMGEDWAVWLLWVGPQSQCAGSEYTHFSNSLGSAQSAGEAQADAAVAAASVRNFGDEYIVYDMEALNTNDPNYAACVSAAQSFINGWEYEMHTVHGQHGAAYGSSCEPPMTDYTAHSNIPEAIFPGDWYHSMYATSPISCVPNNYWDQNQRVHQWSQNSALRFLPGDSGPAAIIDEDCLDGPAQGSIAWAASCS